jgi:hypothetical protein
MPLIVALWKKSREAIGALEPTTGPTTEGEPQTEACDGGITEQHDDHKAFEALFDNMTSSLHVDEKRTEAKPDRHPADTLTSTAGQIASQVERAVAAVIPGADQNQQFEARISVVWELLQCIQEELDQEPCLSRVLTVTAQSTSHAWAVSCREYVESTWGGLGVMFLDSLERALLGTQPDSPGMWRVITLKLVFLSEAYRSHSRPKLPFFTLLHRGRDQRPCSHSRLQGYLTRDIGTRPVSVVDHRDFPTSTTWHALDFCRTLCG